MDDPYLTGSLFHDLLVEPVTAMTGWVADFGAGVSRVLERVDFGVHPNALPHAQVADEPETVRWQGFDVPVAPLRWQLEVNRRRGLTDRGGEDRGVAQGVRSKTVTPSTVDAG